jgi:hypothetical protein
MLAHSIVSRLYADIQGDTNGLDLTVSDMEIVSGFFIFIADYIFVGTQEIKICDVTR